MNFHTIPSQFYTKRSFYLPFHISQHHNATITMRYQQVYDWHSGGKYQILFEFTTHQRVAQLLNVWQSSSIGLGVPEVRGSEAHPHCFCPPTITFWSPRYHLLHLLFTECSQKMIATTEVDINSTFTPSQATYMSAFVQVEVDEHSYFCLVWSPAVR